MDFKALIIIAAWMILSVASEEDKPMMEDIMRIKDPKLAKDDVAVAEVKQVSIKDVDLETGDDDLNSDGSALLNAYAPHGPVEYPHFYNAHLPPFPAFYGKPYAYGYHHGYHHGFPPFFGYGGFGGGYSFY